MHLVEWLNGCTAHVEWYVVRACRKSVVGRSSYLTPPFHRAGCINRLLRAHSPPHKGGRARRSPRPLHPAHAPDWRPAARTLPAAHRSAAGAPPHTSCRCVSRAWLVVGCARRERAGSWPSGLCKIRSLELHICKCGKLFQRLRQLAVDHSTLQMLTQCGRIFKEVGLVIRNGAPLS